MKLPASALFATPLLLPLLTAACKPQSDPEQHAALLKKNSELQTEIRDKERLIQAAEAIDHELIGKMTERTRSIQELHEQIAPLYTRLADEHVRYHDLDRRLKEFKANFELMTKRQKQYTNNQ